MSLSGWIKAVITRNPAHRTDRVAADWRRPFESLSRKWGEVPATSDARAKTTDLAKLGDAELLAYWESVRQELTTGQQWHHRGWYHELYGDFMRGKRVLDVGSGLAVDSITFAQRGAQLTFLDLAESNLALLRRLCGIMGLRDVRFVQLESLDDIDQVPKELDVIMAMGSLHHAPQDVIRPEVARLRQHLKIGGRWLQLAYPKSRWERDGRLSFDRWGAWTDGSTTPWGEWYDLEKLLALHAPARFEVVLYREAFMGLDFNWFDLILRSR